VLMDECQGGGFVPLREGRVSFYVGEHDGGEATAGGHGEGWPRIKLASQSGPELQPVWYANLPKPSR